ncbi:MAG: MqnA/MqnD/SBP family protein [bacterium]
MSVATHALTLGHSPDPDDAFMFYALATHKIDTEGLEFTHILQDIETLNRRALNAELDITAISFHAYAYVSEKYALLSSGASMGDRYGPIVVAKKNLTKDQLLRSSIAIPGTMTSAYLALRLCIGRFNYTVIPFDQIIEAVVRGKVDAGLIIHEGQLTFAGHGLLNVLDLGAWWTEQTNGLPLPLGANVIRKDLGTQIMAKANRIVRLSIQYGLEHRDEAVKYAMQWGRELDQGLTDRFVGMYVNDLTLDYGERGRAGVVEFLKRACGQGVIPQQTTPEFLSD